MSEPTTDAQLDEFLEIRKPGAHLDERRRRRRLRADARRRPRELPQVPEGRRRRHLSRRRTSTSASSSTSTPAPSSPTTAGRTAPTCGSPTSRRSALAAKVIPWSERYLQLCVDGWADEVAKRYGAETDGRDRVDRVERPGRSRARAHAQRVPARRRHLRGPEPARRRGGPRRAPASSTPGCSRPRADLADLSKEQLVTWLLGSHEYLLQCIEAWATQITVRYGLDVMFDIQYTLWGNVVLPGVKKLKERVPRHHRQHRRRLDEGPPDGRDRRCRARRSTCRSRCPSPTSGS